MLVCRTIVIESALVLVLIVLLMIVLAAQTLGGARPGPVRITATCSHSGDQVMMTVPGVFWAERSSIGVGNEFVFTFTSRRCGRQGAWNGLLARLCRAGARPSVLLALVYRRESVDVADGLPLGNGRLRGGGVAVALEARLHRLDSCFESLEFGGLRLDILLSVEAGNSVSSSVFLVRAARQKGGVGCGEGRRSK